MYKFVELENLDSIKLEILKLFPKEFFKLDTLFYIDNHYEIFSNIPNLKNALLKLGIFDYVTGYGFYIKQPYSTGGIHVDRSKFDYSLNIPLIGCSDSQVCFHRCDQEPIFKDVVNQSNIKVGYYSLDHANCQLIDSFYFTNPCIINVKIPHSVINNKNSIRISFLIRLGNNYQLN